MTDSILKAQVEKFLSKGRVRFSSIASVPLVRNIVRPLAGRNLTWLLLRSGYPFARPEAYRIVDTRLEPRASIHFEKFTCIASSKG